MANEIKIYSRQNGEARVPLTVRVEWLPDGTIRPLMYWTPDNTCFKIIVLYECTQLAFLKDGGAGLRFKVQSEIIAADEPYSELLNTRYETYIYLSDKRFSERNIIDDRYSHANKEYIPVTLDIFPDGDYKLKCFKVCGDCYMVEKTEEVDFRGSFNAGGVGIRHRVEARMVSSGSGDSDSEKSVVRTAALFRELNKWFVCVAKSAKRQALSVGVC